MDVQAGGPVRCHTQVQMLLQNHSLFTAFPQPDSWESILYINLLYSLYKFALLIQCSLAIGHTEAKYGAFSLMCSVVVMMPYFYLPFSVPAF